MDLLDPSLVQSQAFGIIENNISQNNPSSINFLLLELMEEIAKNYDVDVISILPKLIATKVLPLLITFLVNKSSTKQEFEKYHEAVMKFITRIKEKKLNEISNSPFKAKADEPDESPITIPTIDEMIANIKSEGFDQLFSKQNQAPAGS